MYKRQWQEACTRWKYGLLTCRYSGNLFRNARRLDAHSIRMDLRSPGKQGVYQMMITACNSAMSTIINLIIGAIVGMLGGYIRYLIKDVYKRQI